MKLIVAIIRPHRLEEVRRTLNEIGVGGMTVSFGAVTIRTVACALILGILANVILSGEKDEAESKAKK